MIECDVCGEDVTPHKELIEGTRGYGVIDLNGKICLCQDCYCALGDFVRSKDFKKVAKQYQDEMIDD